MNKEQLRKRLRYIKQYNEYLEKLRGNSPENCQVFHDMRRRYSGFYEATIKMLLRSIANKNCPTPRLCCKILEHFMVWKEII